MTFRSFLQTLALFATALAVLGTEATEWHENSVLPTTTTVLSADNPVVVWELLASTTPGDRKREQDIEVIGEVWFRVDLDYPPNLSAEATVNHGVGTVTVSSSSSTPNSSDPLIAPAPQGDLVLFASTPLWPDGCLVGEACEQSVTLTIGLAAPISQAVPVAWFATMRTSGGGMKETPRGFGISLVEVSRRP